MKWIAKIIGIAILLLIICVTFDLLAFSYGDGLPALTELSRNVIGDTVFHKRKEFIYIADDIKTMDDQLKLLGFAEVDGHDGRLIYCRNTKVSLSRHSEWIEVIYQGDDIDRYIAANVELFSKSHGRVRCIIKYNYLRTHFIAIIVSVLI